jgi:hypothetical protein
MDTLGNSLQSEALERAALSGDVSAETRPGWRADQGPEIDDS